MRRETRHELWHMVRHEVRPLVWGIGVGLLVGACASPPSYVRPGPDAAAPEAIDPHRVHAVLINGGGRKEINYQSHVIHLRRALGVLESAGVPPAQITVFASDGEEPGPDLATRELAPAHEGWLLDGTVLERSVGRPVEYVSTEIPGVSLRPATRASLGGWFAGEGEALGEGDVVLLYVTDHGTRGSEEAGPGANAISLWGRNESLSVDELADLIDGLPAGVRVVALMSQCYSGAFAQLAHGAGDAVPTGSVCGYFSTTGDREAYGCYAENRGDDHVGHSIRFLEGLAGTGRMAAAHRFTVVNDHTPDVPLRTSDEYAREVLEHAAWEDGRDPVEFADELLAEAWENPGRYERQIRLVDRIGRTFGFASPRRLAEIEERLDQLPRVADPLAKHADAWHAALIDLSRANLDRFLAAHPAWRERLATTRLLELDPEAARELGTALVADLAPSTREDAPTYRRLHDLRRRAEIADQASYRMEVREAALLRMQTVLIEVAARVWLENHAGDRERGAWAALRGCEDLVLPVSNPAPLGDREPFPAYADDLDVARRVLPAWMGIQFDQASGDLRRAHGLGEGAVRVRRVYPSSPAQAAGIEPGDVILGPPGRHFTEPRQIREWTMLSKVDQPRRLDILRGHRRIELTLVPGPHPGRFPDLPAPPGAGDVAPPLRLTAYREALPASLVGDGPHLLFFWATWCVPCKAALPELLAYSEAREVPVLAITEESPARLDRFFAGFDQAFPRAVAVDRARSTFLAYGVSGTPSFVLVGGDGVVRSTSTGYSREKGLGIAGWKWGG